MSEFRRRGEFELEVVEPYDFHLTSSAYSFGWYYDGKELLIPLEGSVVSASWSKGKIRCVIYGEAEGVEEEVKHILGAEEDLKPYYARIKKDPILSVLATKYHGMRMRAWPSLWSSLVVAVLNQNTSFYQGWRMIRSFYASLGKKVRVGRKITLLSPTPKQVLRKKEMLKKCGLGYRWKILLEIARTYDESWERSSSQKLIEELEQIKGVGDYSAKLAVLLRRRDYNLLPTDRWLMKILPPLYGYGERAFTKKEVEEFANERWGPWKGLSYFFLTIVLEARTAGEILGKRKTRLTLNPLNLYKEVVEAP